MSFFKNNKEKTEIKKTPGFVKRIWKIRSIPVLILSGLLTNILGWIFLRWQINADQTTMILHYNSFLGIDVIDFNFQEGYYQIFFVSLGGLLIWLINTILGLMLIKQSAFFSGGKKEIDRSQLEKKVDEKIVGSYLLWGGSLLVQLIILVYVIAIVMVNK